MAMLDLSLALCGDVSARVGVWLRADDCRIICAGVDLSLCQYVFVYVLECMLL